MSNLRIVYDNATDRKSSLVASSSAGSLGVNNLLTETKSQVWRSTSTSATLTIEWANAEFVGVVALPFCNFTSTATMRVRGYTGAADSVPVFDTGAKLCCAYTPFGLWGWGSQPLGVNAYSYGGATYAVVWFETTPVEKIVIDIDNTGNSSGYVEASRLVTGAYWSPENNCNYNARITTNDMSKHGRTDSGDLKTDRGAMYKSIALDLSMMPSGDRNRLWDIIRGNGITRPIFFSLSPESDDPSEEQMFQIYGKLSRQLAITYQFINQFNAPLEIEEV